MKPWALCLCLSSSSFVWCQHFKVLHSFSGYPKDGAHSISDVVFDKNGNLYGTTAGGGSGTGCGDNGCGTVFDIPASSGDSVLQGTVSFDTSGNLYSSFSGTIGGVFQLSPSTRRLRIFSFNGSNGKNPQGGVYLPSQAGKAYGTAASGGDGNGTLFQVDMSGKGSVLHTFCSWNACNDGATPWPTQVPDRAGNLYGTTEFGGFCGGGVVWEVSP
jgi:uncharacterized repeat protein (TIGR03803 family)